ncbi:hypothetical protein JCM3775_003962 [Rhodotorula graminis]
MYTHRTTHAPLGSVRRPGPPFSSLRERPLSIASTLSAVSVVSEASTSSVLANTGERRRRSAVLLELDVDDATRSSLRRAEQALRASERDRQWDVRRSSWRERQGRSLHFQEDLPGAGEVEELEGPPEVEATTTAVPTAKLGRFSPQRLLYKTRSVPSSIALSAEDNMRPASPAISGPKRKSPLPSKVAAPRRSASTANLLSTGPTAVRHSLSPTRPTSPPQHEHFGTLPLRLSHLPPPQHELPSKFSASSGDSMVHVVSFGAGADKPRRGLKDRARTFSQASAGGLKSLKSKVGRSRSMRGKSNRLSLANLFVGLGGSSDESDADQAKQPADSSAKPPSAATSSGTSGHRPSTSISSYAPSTAAATSDSGRPSRKPSRLGFFRSTLKRDSSSSKRNSIRTRSSGQVSPSLISRPVSLSAGESFSPPSNDKRSSEATAPSVEVHSGDDKTKGGWASRLSQAVKGKNVAAKRALFENPEVGRHAHKITASTAASPDLTARARSRDPLSSVFPHVAAPVRPPRPSKNLESSDDTTFYGHRIPAVKSRAAALDALVIQSSAPRVRPKSSLPVAAKSRALPPPPMPSFLSGSVFPRGAAVKANSYPSNVRLPPAPVSPDPSTSARRHSPDSFDLTDSSLSPADLTSASYLSSSDEDRCASPARSFRSPSPARFRDLLPSAPAGSSPEKNERGLPMPQEASPTSARRQASPKKRAMGPEQVILMEDAKQQQGPFTEVCGATTDLADLLSGLEDTEDFNTSRQVGAPSATRSHIQYDVSDLSASLRGQLPHVDSIESLRSSISDVPVDLKQLINAVDDHISEVDVPYVVVEGFSMTGRVFADEDSDSSCSSSSSSSSDGSSDDDRTQNEDEGTRSLATYANHHDRPFLSVVGEHTTGLLGSDGGLTTCYDLTASSFEGHFSTAAAALRSMLAGPEPGVSSPPESATLRAFPPPASATLQAFQLAEIDEEPRSSSRDSLREALELGRPSNGERMFYEVDDAVPLSALLQDPSPTNSPEMSLMQARETAFLRHHLRSASAISSSEGTGESFFSTMGSPTPLPSTGRPLRQSLARYSQDRFPVKRPSHRARPVSEQSSMSSSDQGHNSSEQTTSSIAAPSTRSTNLSVSSLTSSPCPAPSRRHIPMLTSNALPLPSQPAFRFPPPKGAAVAEQTREWVASEGGEVGRHAPGSGSNSPRYVRSLERSSPGDPPPRPRLLDLDTDLVSPDTPPPSSPSDGELHVVDLGKSSRSSSEVAHAPLATVERKMRHGRQTSRSSSIMQSVIVEEAESPASPARPVSLELRAYLQPLSPIQEPPSPQTVPHGPLDDSPSVRIELAEVDYFSNAHIVDLEPHDDLDFTAETNPELTSRYFSFTYEAETELKRSPAIWPDTDYSREVIAHWLVPRTYHAILEFIFYSQTRFPSPPHLVRLSSWVPLAFDDPPTPPSPVRIPPPIVDSPPDAVDVVLTTRAAPVRRKPLAAKPLNRQVAELSRSTSSPSKKPKEDLSPFTALPPRLSSKLRSLRGGQPAPTENAKKVDTGFLGDNATRRRQGQFNAAMRKLEGVGAPAEQRSDEETDDTGVLEAKGEATEELSFTKTPRLSTVRPKVRHKAGLASMR